MSLFLRLLPSDVQIHVLHEWISNEDTRRPLLLTLSSLDVACTNRSDQKWIRTLIGLLPPFEESTQALWHKADRNMSAAMMVAFLCWLRSRNAHPRTLLLLGSRADLDAADELEFQTSVPSVESIYWRKPHHQIARLVLWSCPNLTALDMHEVVDLPASITVLLPKLRDVTMRTMPLRSSYPPQLELVERIGHQLHSLSLPDAALSPQLASQIVCRCVNLRQLSVSGREGLQFFLDLLQSCKQLEDLKLCATAALSIDELAQIMAKKQIKRLHVSSCTLYETVFATVLELRPDLDLLTVGKNSFVRQDRLLRWKDGEVVDLNLLKRILNVCSPLDAFAMWDMREDVECLLAERLAAGRLKSLQLITSTRRLFPNLRSGTFIKLISNCGHSLTHLHVEKRIDNAVCCLIAANCPMLTSLKLINTDPRNSVHNWTDDDMVVILAACSSIKYLMLCHMIELKGKLFGHIVAHRRVLEHLELHYGRTSGIIGKAVARFCEQLKVRQLLPVPRIVIQMSGNWLVPASSTSCSVT